MNQNYDFSQQFQDFEAYWSEGTEVTTLTQEHLSSAKLGNTGKENDWNDCWPAYKLCTADCGNMKQLNMYELVKTPQTNTIVVIVVYVGLLKVSFCVNKRKR